MRIYRCENCSELVHFDNTTCTRCAASLGFIPEEGRIGSFRQTAEGEWLRYAVASTYWRRCANADTCSCNWLIPDDDPNALCRSCRLTAVIPDQSVAENRVAWRDLESAKRAWLATVLELALPARSREEDPERGLSFHFLRQLEADKPVLTGHAAGEITINAIESDPVARERSKLNLHEPYRTLLGHFRHESGHYYWDLLVRDTLLIDAFRTLFGDERQDYAQALERHYAQGPSADWHQGFVSGYATMHPWEDWAETWAHYLHMIDLLATAQSWQLSVGAFDRAQVAASLPDEIPLSAEFTAMLSAWIPLTLVANGLNRSLGHSDAYPFALPYRALRKIQFVHDVVKPFRIAASASPARAS